MLEFMLVVLLTPFVLAIGLSILGFILGLLADPLYGMPDERARKENIKRRRRKNDH